MKRYSEYLLVGLLVGLLLAIYWFLGQRVLMLAGGFAAMWFVIAVILLSRPPGVPEFVSEQPGSDEQYVIRKDVVPRLPWLDRIRLALSVSCGCCLLLWISLVLLAV